MDRYQQPLDGQGNMPTQPMGRTPTPPYSPSRKNAPTPIQRFNEMQSRPVTSTPDGRPASLPVTGSRYLWGVAGAAISGGPSAARQRFSGSGLLPQTHTQRTERRAQVMTLSLAGVAVLLIVGSALLLFQPTVQWPGFGFKLGQQFSHLASNIPLIIQGTPPPVTPTPRPSPGTATPGRNTGSTAPTATPAPAATATPAAEPTATSPAAIPTATAAATAIPTAIRDRDTNRDTNRDRGAHRHVGCGSGHGGV